MLQHNAGRVHSSVVHMSFVQMDQGAPADLQSVQLPENYKWYHCYRGDDMLCGCVKPLKDKPKAERTVVHCSTAFKALGAGHCTHNTSGCGAACKTPQCSAHGVCKDSGTDVLLQSLAQHGYGRSIIVQWPVKLDPVHNTSRKPAGSKHGTGGQFGNDTCYLDVVLVKHDGTSLVAVEMQGGSHGRTCAKVKDAAKENAAKFVGIDCFHADADDWQSLAGGSMPAAVQQRSSGRARKPRTQMHAEVQTNVSLELMPSLST